MLENFKIFPKLVGLSALLVAGSAAFFSVFGLSKLFAGATLSVIIMAGSLEFAKLIAASFLYRYWTQVNNFLKYYLMIGTIVLVLITSAGIFGYLSNAYQGATVAFEKQTTALLAYEDRLEQLEEDKVFLKEELDAQIASLPENYITAKRKLREDFNPQIQNVNAEMLDIKGKIGDLKIELVETGVDVGPAIYLARTFETDVDTVVKFFIFILIFVFDPMAIALVIAFNMAMGYKELEIYQKEEQVNTLFKKYKKEKPKTFTRDEKKKIVDVEEEKPKPKTKKIEYVEEKPIDKKVFGKDAAVPPRGNKK